MNQSLAGMFGFVLFLLGLGLPFVGMEIMGNDLLPCLLGMVSFGGAYVFLKHAFSACAGCGCGSTHAGADTLLNAKTAKCHGNMEVSEAPPSVN